MQPKLTGTLAVAVAFGLGIALGLAMDRAVAAFDGQMPRTARELEDFVWKRVEECHSTDGYLRCPSRLSRALPPRSTGS